MPTVSPARAMAEIIKAAINAAARMGISARSADFRTPIIAAFTGSACEAGMTYAELEREIKEAWEQWHREYDAPAMASITGARSERS